MTSTAVKLLLNVLGGSAPSFSPLDIPGLTLWLDASDSTTLFQDSAGTIPATADNDVIGKWADKSGNGNHATQATTADKPVLKLALQNGRNILRFSATDALKTIAVVQTSVESTMVLVAASASDGLLFYTGITGGGGSGGYGFNTVSGNRGVLFGGIAGKTDGAASASAEIQTMRHQTGATTFYVNGTQVSITNASINPNAPGAGQTSLASGMTIDIMEAYSFNYAVPVASLAILHSYLVARWGIALP